MLLVRQNQLFSRHFGSVIKSFPIKTSVRRCLNTLSPLGAAFNAKPQFRWDKWNTVGLFEIPQLTDYTGFYLLQESVKEEVEQLVSEATGTTRTRKLVQVFDQLSDTLCRVADMADFVRIAHCDQQYCQAADDTCMVVSGLVEKLNTNVDIYTHLKAVLEHGDIVKTDEIDQRVGELFLFDFEQSGIHLSQETRETFVKLNESIMSVGNYFMQGTQNNVSIPKEQLPENIRHCFGREGNNILVTGLFTDHFSDLVREAAYKIYLYPENHQASLLDSLLKSRYSLANMVGFKTYAHRTLRGTLAETQENVMDFLETLAEQVKPKADKDFDDILQIKIKQSSQSKQVQPWDPPYYSALARNQRCSVDKLDVAPYFSLGVCMEGLNMIFSSLYGVTLVSQDAHSGELWANDVHKLAVVHESEGVLGYIYCDFFDRPNKPNQDCHFTIRGGRQMETGDYQDPVVVLMLGLTPRHGSIPCLLTHGQVENLFHEFGHAMHSMLGRTHYQHVTGTRCPTDFAEVPSVLMEYFASDPRILSKFARHFDSGKPLPESMLSNLCTARRMFAASELQLQVFYSILDQVFHSEPSDKPTMEVLAQVQNKYYSLPHVPNTAWHLRFGHFVGYGAKYYSYLMSRAVASRIWHRCFKDDPLNRTMGERYRQEILAHGGGKPPADLVEALLNERPATENLVQSLMDDLEGL